MCLSKATGHSSIIYVYLSRDIAVSDIFYLSTAVSDMYMCLHEGILATAISDICVFFKRYWPQELQVLRKEKGRYILCSLQNYIDCYLLCFHFIKSFMSPSCTCLYILVVIKCFDLLF